MRKTILKHCPFCGQEGSWLSEIRLDSSLWWAYGCHNRTCGMKPQTPFCETKKQAASLWNLRTPKPTETWTMEFVFNEQKAQALGYTAESCYEAVDKVFACYGIVPVSQGLYEMPANQNSFDALGTAQRLPYSDWFLKTIEEWSCYEDGDYAEPEDCLESYYKHNLIEN